MNAAKFERSGRLQRVVTLLKQGGEHSTRDIIRHAHVCAVNSIAGELRQQGFNIPKAKRRGGNFYYKLNRPYRLKAYKWAA